ncbi:MAG: polyphenol oxidase family protein [Planctomycetota bacterium]
MSDPTSPHLDLFAAARPRLPGLIALYGTRRGGVSARPFDSGNLGFSTGDDPAAVVENRRRLAASAGISLDALVVAGQCHGAEVAVLGVEDRGEGARAPSERLRGFDALLLRDPGVYALSLSADCPLVVLADPESRIAGVAHAGWRGTAAGIVGALVEAFRARGSRPEALWAAQSPGICGGCYEVGEEVLEAVAGRPGAREACSGRFLDLRGIHRAELLAHGLRAGRVLPSVDCSFEDPRRFFSHRRDRGITGRNGVLVGWS